MVEEFSFELFYANRTELWRVIMSTDKHNEFIETGLNITEDIEGLIKLNEIPLHYIFGSPGIYTRKINLVRLLAQYELFQMSRDVPGSIVECGVFQGAGLLFYAKLIEIFCSGDRWKKVYGFDPSRSERWKNEISDWELNLCEYLAKEQLAFAGYKESLLDLNPIALKKGMDNLKNNSVLSQSLQHFELSREGTDKAAMDPTDPMNWDAPDDAFTKFTASSGYSKYVKEHQDLEEYLKTQYHN